MRLDPAYSPISAEDFLAMDFGTDRKFELVDGVIHMMTGGSSDHSRVAGNIYHFLRLKLKGTHCRPFGSDMAVRIDDTNVRFPDVAVYCGDPWSVQRPAVLAYDDPRVLFEVLSPSTSSFDQGTKLEEYRWLKSLDAVVFVDPVNELTRLFERTNGDSWHDTQFAKPHDVSLPSLGIILTAGEIFARD